MSQPDKEMCINETRDWISKMVLGLNLCPFAHRPFNEDLIRYTVLEADRTAIEQINQEIKLLIDAELDDMETSLIILPQEIGFIPYLNLIDQIEKLIIDQDLEGIVQVASFHPEYQFQDLSSEDVRNYTNRSPYPMIHLLREESVTRAVQRHGNTHQIPIDNQNKLLSIGKEGVEKLLRPEF